jgi:hypothetical protein
MSDLDEECGDAVVATDWDDPERCPFCGAALADPGAGFIDHVEESEPCKLGFERWCENVSGEWRGNRHPRPQHVPLSEFLADHGIDKDGFEGDAPDEICSYCWSNTRETIGKDQERVSYNGSHTHYSLPRFAQCRAWIQH